MEIWAGSEMNQIEEVTILEANNVKVTNQRAVIGTKTYSLSDDVSAGIVKDRSMVGCLMGALITGALITGLLSFANPEISSAFRIAAAILFGAAIIVAVLAQPNYILQITSGSVKADVLQSMDRDYLEAIVDAIDQVVGAPAGDDEVRAGGIEKASRP